MRAARRAGVAAALAFGLCTGGRLAAARFDAPPGPIGAVAAALGARAGATVAVADPAVAILPSPGVRGARSLRAALAHALRGTAARAIFDDAATVRIVRRRLVAPQQQPPPPPEPDRTDGGEIVVTATKQRQGVDSYPGSVRIVAMDPSWLSRNPAAGTASLARTLPTLGATNLGPGRDKLFIRGIADSSFAGPTQATTGQYLGDVRLNYNAPDPDLNLYDMKRVEVLIGPQGTLYGASTLGGVVRLVPNAPDMRDTAATTAIGLSSTAAGGIGGDGAAMLNLPIVADRLALRIVAFGGRDAGYIDDPSRGRRDVDRTVSVGQRLTLRWRTESGWTVDFGFILQNIATRDGQYAQAGEAPLTRRSAIAQPFTNDYRLGSIVARRAIGAAELISATSIVRHHLTTVFDATGYDGTAAPARYREDDDITLFSHETRLSGGSSRAPWVAGIAGLFNAGILSRSLGPVDAPATIPGVANIQAEGALFGEYAHPFSRTLTGTIGGRLTLSNSTGIVLNGVTGKLERSSRDTLNFTSTLALDWRPPGRVSAFFHFQQGYRAGGLAVAPSESGLSSQKFVADDLAMNEIGIRLGDRERDRLSIRTAMFAADWNNIQADLIDTTGLPYTANIGRGRLYGLDGEVAWRPVPSITLTAAAFVNDSRLYRPAPGFGAGGRTLPNIPHAGSRVAAAWRRTLGSGTTIGGEAAMRYVGRSRLGVGPVLDVPQGGYMVGDIDARLDFGRFALSLGIDNIGDARANTFGFGNPFGVARRDQLTPLRPRTVRLGIDAKL